MSFRTKGRRLWESTRTGNKKLAERMHAQRTLEVAEGRFTGGASNRTADGSMHTLTGLIERYKAEVQFKKRWPARDTAIFEHLTTYFGNNAMLNTLDVTVCGYERWRNKKRAAAATIVKELGLLGRMCRLAVKWRWMSLNPVSLVELPRITNNRVRYLNPEELQKLTVAMPAWIRPIVTLARSTGLRRENILSLTWQQIDLHNGFVSLPITKNGEGHIVPLNATALKALERASKIRRLDTPWVFCGHNGERFTGDAVSMAFKRICRKAGISDLRFHDLRHDFASRLVQRGVDIYRVKGLLGHKDLRMTTRYAHLSPENLQAVKVLDDATQLSFIDATGYDLVTLEKDA